MRIKKLKKTKSAPKAVGTCKTQKMDIDSLLKADYNPRQISNKAMKGLENSVKTFGLVQPIVWNKETGHIVGGHQRLEVLKKQGASVTDVVVVSLSSEEEKLLNITLNHDGVVGYFIESQLNEIIDEVKDYDAELAEKLNLYDLENFSDWDDTDGEIIDNIPEYNQNEDGFTIKVQNVEEHLVDSVVETMNNVLKGTGYKAEKI